MPLSALARAYARLASSERDAESGDSFRLLAQAMVAHPELVSGTARSDLAFMKAGRGDWVTKVGADGVQAFASTSRGQAFALKVIDGNKVALFAATVAVLDQLGWLDARQKDELRPWRAEAIANTRGTQVGERKPAFRLRAAGWRARELGGQGIGPWLVAGHAPCWRHGPVVRVGAGCTRA